MIKVLVPRWHALQAGHVRACVLLRGQAVEETKMQLVTYHRLRNREVVRSGSVNSDGTASTYSPVQTCQSSRRWQRGRCGEGRGPSTKKRPAEMGPTGSVGSLPCAEGNVDGRCCSGGLWLWCQPCWTRVVTSKQARAEQASAGEMIRARREGSEEGSTTGGPGIPGVPTNSPKGAPAGAFSGKERP